MTVTLPSHTAARTALSLLTGTVVLLALYATSLYSRLLFHSLTELVSVIVAFLIFVLAWNTRRLLDNRYLLFIGIASFFWGAFSIGHMLAYKGMDVFPGFHDDLALQLWVVSRYLFGLSFLLAPVVMGRKTGAGALFLAWGLVASAAAAAIFAGRFPACYAPGSGFTQFKMASEYLIALLLTVSLGLLYWKRDAFDRRVYRLLGLSLAASMFEAVSYTQNVVVVDAANMAGHYFDLIANYLLYRAIVVTSVVEPSSLLFRDLRKSEEALRAATGDLERRVRQRTADLVRSNEELHQEIAERIRAEESLLRLEAAVNATAEAVVITDPSTGVIQFVNPAFERITGYGREESLGRTLHFLESGEHDEEYFRGVREALKHSGVWSGRLLNRKKDGTVYHEECAISIVRDASGAVANYVYVKRDVTEKARLEKIAESLKTMETIGYVFSGLRNEIGNPINALNMIIGVLRTRLGSLAPESVRQYVDRMAGQIDRVEHLLRRMRNFSLFETHRPRSIPLEEFLESFLALVREDFVSAGIALEVSRASEAQRVFADPWALQQILLNILNNARDALAGRPDPLIRLDVTKERGRIRFSIRDNGSGMTDTVRKSLFQPFFTTKENGMGLGLVIVKKLLAHMRGDIAVAGEAGAGTTVDITVPEEEG